MKGDFSRQTFDAGKHYSSVRMQQGRVQLDADWNEQADLVAHRDEAIAASLVGASGAPYDDAGFGIALFEADLEDEDLAWLEANEPSFKFGPQLGEFVIKPGRYYVDGVLCVCEHPIPFTRQADLPEKAIEVAKEGFLTVYLDVWERHLTWLDDATLRETALGGPDTATRTKTVWQVRTLFSKEEPACGVDSEDYLQATAPSSGRLRARARPEAVEADPCLVPASAGYRGLENQLYRVEVHAGEEALDPDTAQPPVDVVLTAPNQVAYEEGEWEVGAMVEIFPATPGEDPLAGWVATVAEDRDGTLTLSAALPEGVGGALRMRPAGATCKWSRDNGSLVTPVVSAPGRELVVASLGPDATKRLARGAWVELTDEALELKGEPGYLCQVEDVDPGTRKVTLLGEPSVELSGKWPRLRHWDGALAMKRSPQHEGGEEPFAELEDGIGVAFSKGRYHCGDYWLIPARTATADALSGTIEWPERAPGDPLAELPQGIRHRYAKLAVLAVDGKALDWGPDCRTLFPPLAKLDTLVYAGGDGQQVAPGETLALPLRAGVFRGPLPVAGAKVRFRTKDGLLAEQPGSPFEGRDAEVLSTDENGIAACYWQPAGNPGASLSVEASLLTENDEGSGPTLHYGAELRRPPVASGGCCRQVDPEENLEAVFRELVEEGHKSICLCLEAGEYKLSSVEFYAPGEEVSLTIKGAGSSTKLISDTGVNFRYLVAARLADLELQLLDEEHLELRCRSVSLERCRVFRGEGDEGTTCVINADQVLVSQSVIDSGDAEHTALALGGYIPQRRRVAAHNPDVLIDWSRLEGALTHGSRFAAEMPSEKRLTELAEHVRKAKGEASGSLQIRNSRILRLAAGSDAVEEMLADKGRPILQRISLTDTTITGVGSVIVAVVATISTCGFPGEGTAGEDEQEIVGKVAAEMATITATWGGGGTLLHVAPSWQASAAANILIMVFDVIAGSEV